MSQDYNDQNTTQVTQNNDSQNTAVLKQIIDNLEVVDFTEYMTSRRAEEAGRSTPGIDEGLTDEESEATAEDTLNGFDPEERNAAAELTIKAYKILFIEALIDKTKGMGLPLAQYNGEVRVYTSSHWSVIDEDSLGIFLLKASEKIGVPRMVCRDADFIKKSIKQLQLVGHVTPPNIESNAVLNFSNGTLFFDDTGFYFESHDAEDYINYVLPYEYNPEAGCPLFRSFLDRVLPQNDKQLVLAEFFASCFSSIKHEKVLINYGTGSNGKSVLYDIMCALFGEENVLSHTLEELTDPNGYHRGELANCLLNFSGEMSTKLSSDMFKKLASGEKVSARYPYGRPFEVTDYSRLGFNCNELPDAEDTTEGYYRRFLIVHFDVYIPKAERDLNLAQKIIANELPGIMNWVLEGLVRLQEQQGFSECQSANQILEWYKRNTNSVISFIESDRFANIEQPAKASLLYSEYLEYCESEGLNSLGTKNFSIKLAKSGFTKYRRADGMYYERNEASYAD